jgi:hypothetical protein
LVGILVGIRVGWAVVGDGVIAIIEMVNSRGMPGFLFKYGTAVTVMELDGTERISAALKPPDASLPAKEYGGT